MNVGLHTNSAYANPYLSSRVAATKKALQQAAATAATWQKDTVTLSAAYRSNRQIVGNLAQTGSAIRSPSTKANAFTFGPLQFSNRAWSGEQTAAEAATGFKYYTEPGRVDAEITASRQAETDSLGKKIEQALYRAGIELSDADKLKFTVSRNGQISIDPSGLTGKNKNKVQDIETALNSEPGLGKQLMLSSAATALHEADMRRKSNPTAIMTEYELGNNDPRVAAAHKATLDEYLQSTFGFGIDELEADGYGSESAENYGKKAQAFEESIYENMSFDDSNQFRAHVSTAIHNAGKEESVDFEASYTYQNGTLVDNKADGAAEKLAAAAGQPAEQPGSASATTSVEDKAKAINAAWSALHADKTVEDKIAKLMDSNASSSEISEAIQEAIEKMMEKSSYLRNATNKYM